MSSLAELLKDLRKCLVDTGNRTRLIHVNRLAKRGNFLNIINERSDEIYKLLRTNEKKMRFAAKGQEEDEQFSDDIDLGYTEEIDSERHTDSILDTPLTPDALQKRLLRLAQDAKTAEEEQGINILFLALGFLQWNEAPNSDIMRESPLILIPVDLIRNNKKSTFDIKCRDDDIVTNLPLQERLKSDFGVVLPEIDDSNEWVPSKYFKEVSEAISKKTGCAIDTEGMQLGFFSFAKLMMFHDLDSDNWKGDSLLSNELIKGLLKDGFEEDASPLFNENDNLDEVLSPEKIFQVVDADASQTKVIEEVRSGKNLVVQGPPGTGKSQTITNILAAAAHDKKTVLFVAEKMAALKVVHSRMCNVGLKNLCLELHSRNANKKTLLQNLEETICAGTRTQPVEPDAITIKSSRDKLNKITNDLHKNLPNREYSPYSALSYLIGFTSNGVRAPIHIASKLEYISVQEENNLFGSLKKYIDIIREHGLGQENPFFGVSNLDLQPTDIPRLKVELQEVLDKVNLWIDYQHKIEQPLYEECIGTFSSVKRCKSIYQQLQAAPKDTPQFIEVVHQNIQSEKFLEALKAGRKWIKYKREISQKVTNSIWSQELSHLRPEIVKGTSSWILRFLKKYRSASAELAAHLKNELPKEPSERLKKLDEIIAAKEEKKLFDEDAAYLEGILGEEWRGERTPFDTIITVYDWLNIANKEVSKFSADKLKDLIIGEAVKSFDTDDFDKKYSAQIAVVEKISKTLGWEGIAEESVDNLQNKLRKMVAHMEQYQIWKQFKFAEKDLLKFPVDELLKMIDEKKIDIDMAESELKYVLNEVRWKRGIEERPNINKLQNINRHEIVKKFSDNEKHRFLEIQSFIKNMHLSKIPQGGRGGMGIIRDEIAKTRRHLPIRRLMNETSEIIQRIKPIFLMSPISVAQFLPPGKIKFDILVMDEASQVKPEEALGSIARAKQIVIVGDKKQLPPTSFFDRIADDSDVLGDEEEETITRVAEMESVLSLCEARGINQRMLEWHYRSRDPSLITVSNREFYENRLIFPPCPTQTDDNFGMKLTKVPGVYSSAKKGGGRAGTNKIEAEAVVNRLKDLANKRADFSVGIVTFSKAQADMITEVLEFQRREDGILDAFLREDKHENVFVKNIENVQGDERDIILISVGYGPHEANGRLSSMRFGPVNSEGGERRLNVLFTRSRIECEIFTSFEPSDITPARTDREGPATLKKFLEYAKTKVLPEINLPQGEADSLFEENVAQEIRNLGYEVEYQVGAAGFKIDLGVRYPKKSSHYMLAVECDGATYHSALSARERDRMRQEILENLGWHFHRIWSTDWYYTREKEIQRLKEVLKNAENRDITSSLKGANLTSPMPIEPPPTDDKPDIKEVDYRIPKYVKAVTTLYTTIEPHEQSLSKAVGIIFDIVKIEGLLHIDEIARRYASAHEKSRVGARISAKVEQGLKQAERIQMLKSRGKFWGTLEQFKNVPIRDRGLESSPTLSSESLPPDEIIACAKLIERESGKVSREELIQEIAKVLGFKRTSAELNAVISKALSL